MAIKDFESIKIACSMTNEIDKDGNCRILCARQKGTYSDYEVFCCEENCPLMVGEKEWA